MANAAFLGAWFIFLAAAAFSRSKRWTDKNADGAPWLLAQKRNQKSVPLLQAGWGWGLRDQAPSAPCRAWDRFCWLLTRHKVASPCLSFPNRQERFA